MKGAMKVVVATVAVAVCQCAWTAASAVDVLAPKDALVEVDISEVAGGEAVDDPAAVTYDISIESTRSSSRFWRGMNVMRAEPSDESDTTVIVELPEDTTAFVFTVTLTRSSTSAVAGAIFVLAFASVAFLLVGADTGNQERGEEYELADGGESEEGSDSEEDAAAYEEESGEKAPGRGPCRWSLGPHGVPAWVASRVSNGPAIKGSLSEPLITIV